VFKPALRPTNPLIQRVLVGYFREYSGRGVNLTTYTSSVEGKNGWSHVLSRRGPGRFTITFSFPSPIQRVQSAVECRWRQILKPNIRNPSALGKVNLKLFVCTARRRIEGMEVWLHSFYRQYTQVSGQPYIPIGWPQKKEPQ